jgi:hypothetical protein
MSLGGCDLAYDIKPGLETVTGCDGCGHETRTFRGLVYEDGEAFGIYVAAYTDGHPELGVSMAVSMRGWGEGVDPLTKECVALEWRNAENGPGVVVVDGEHSTWANEVALGRLSSRAVALSSGIAEEAFAISDAVWVADERLSLALAV